jgi:hypothetical protein
LEPQGEFAIHYGIKCESTKEEIIGARYYTKSYLSGGNIRCHNYCEQEFLRPQESDVDPLIFIRLANPIDSICDLPGF